MLGAAAGCGIERALLSWVEYFGQKYLKYVIIHFVFLLKIRNWEMENSKRSKQSTRKRNR